jgi:hypothetical protein
MTLKLAATAHDRDGEQYTFQAVHDPDPDWPVGQSPGGIGHGPPPELPALWRWPEHVPLTFRPGPGAFTPPAR